MPQQLTNLRADMYPVDPDAGQVRLYFDAATDGYATLEIRDAAGRPLLDLGPLPIRPGPNTLTWHGHDAEGWPLADGSYAVRLVGTGRDRRRSAHAPLHLDVTLRRRRPVTAPYSWYATRVPPAIPAGFHLEETVRQTG